MPTPYVGSLPNGFWDRFKTTRTSRLYKGYRIDGDGSGKRFTVQGNTFGTMREAQRWVDAEIREEGAAARYHERETARALRAEAKAERERDRREKREAARKVKAARVPKVKAAKVGRGTGTSRYKGYTLKRQAEGGWVVPQLDSGSVFEDKHEAKRFVDSQIYGVQMKRNGRGRSPRRNAATRKRRTVKTGTLVPAKLKRMPNGTIKVLVSPGAVARLKGTAVNPKPKRRRRR